MKRTKDVSARVLLGTFILIVLAAVSPVHAQEYISPWAKDLSVGVGADYSTGTYGTGTRTNSLVIPVTVEWRPLSWLDVQVGVPYIYQNNTVTPAFVTTSGSGAAPAGSESELAAANPAAQAGAQGKSQGAQGSQAAAQGAGGVASPERKNSQNGIGDLSLQAGVTFLQEGELLPQLRALLYLKCPTGDKNNWLGSGEFDEGIGLAVSRSVGDLSLYLEGMWIFQGGSDFLKESGYTARDYFNYYTEIGYQATASLIPAVALRGTTPTSDEQGGVAEARLKLAWKATEQISFQIYAGIGLTTSANDASSGMSLFYNF